MSLRRLAGNPIGARIYVVGNKTVLEDAAQHQIDYGAIAYQYGGMGVDLTNNQLIAPVHGLYLWTCKAYYYSPRAGDRRVVAQVNYSNIDEIGGVALAGAEQFYVGVLPIEMNAGDVLTADAYVGGTAGATTTATLYGAQPYFTWMSLILQSA